MTMPLDLVASHVALKSWVDGQLGEDGALLAYAAGEYTTVWGHQNGPRPDLPYAVLSWPRAFATVGGKPARSIVDGEDDTFVERVEYDAEAVFRVEIFSSAALDPDSGVDEALALACGLEASIRTSRQLELFMLAGLAFVENGPPLAVPVVAGFGFERRAQLDITFRARVRVDALDVPVLDSTSVTDISGTVDEDGAIIGTVGTA